MTRGILLNNKAIQGGRQAGAGGAFAGGRGQHLWSNTGEPTSTSHWSAGFPLLRSHWSTQVRRRPGGDTRFTSTQLIWGEDRARWPNEQLLFTLVTASQLQQCRSKQTGVSEYPGSYIRSGPNAGMGGREVYNAFRPVWLIGVQ